MTLFFYYTLRHAPQINQCILNHFVNAGTTSMSTSIKQPAVIHTIDFIN